MGLRVRAEVGTGFEEGMGLRWGLGLVGVGGRNGMG